LQKYFLGVDGGNTKTDYLLCTAEGTLVDVYRTGTCSHECFKDGYDGMERLMREQLSRLFERNGINVSHIASAGFGLAGADLPSQIAQLKMRVEAIGFTSYGLYNDGILGIKGASDSGIGLCAVNGTGTVIVGIDENGDMLQVGGVGPLSGDYAGGGYIKDQIISLLYDFHYRHGADSSMFAQIMELLEAAPEDLLTVVSDSGLLSRNTVDIIKIGSQAALDGDDVAKKIFDDIGVCIGKSAAGCLRHLSFKGFGTAENPIEIVQIGSIWHKVPYEGMNTSFLRTVQGLSGKHCSLIKLEAPPAVGGILWAKEIADNVPVASGYRKSLLEAVSMEKYEALVFKTS